MTLQRPENRHQVALLRRLRDEGPRSRAELGDGVELSRTKLAAEVDRLIELGLVEATGLAASRGGRRSTALALSSRTRLLGVDIGATSVDVALADAQLEVLGHLREDVDVRLGPDVVLDRALDLARKLLADEPGTVLAGVGVGVPGPVNFDRGEPVSPPIMPGWNGYPVRERFATALGCPVVVDNDVNIMALGEKHAGIARRAQDFLFVKIGTGIGCGVVVRGEVYRGVNGSAGDIGHIQVDDAGPVCTCGNVGCLEAYFGGAALRRDATTAARSGRSVFLAERLEQTGSLSAADVGAAAEAGDPEAVAMVRSGGRVLGEVLASLVSFFNPGLVVLGGGVTGLGHELLAQVRSVVYQRSLPLATGNLPIVISELDGAAGVIGAARTISDQLYSTVSGSRA
ncbi:ROK family transcriptional regulator [Angustibacter peucedani]